jgi:hypothetical protein
MLAFDGSHIASISRSVKLIPERTALADYRHVRLKLGFTVPRSMHIFTLTTLLAGLCWSTPAPDRVIHERRHITPAGWSKRARLAGDQLLPLRIGLSQRNLERGEEILDSVSNPASKRYGAYFSAQQVAEMFRPR